MYCCDMQKPFVNEIEIMNVFNLKKACRKQFQNGMVHLLIKRTIYKCTTSLTMLDQFAVTQYFKLLLNMTNSFLMLSPLHMQSHCHVISGGKECNVTKETMYAM